MRPLVSACLCLITTFLMVNMVLLCFTCLLSLLNLHLMLSKVFKQTGVEQDIRDNKSAAVTNQIIAGSAMLRQGRMCPLRLVRWPVQKQMLVQPSTYQGLNTVCRHLIRSNLSVCRNLMWHNPSTYNSPTP